MPKTRLIGMILRKVKNKISSRIEKKRPTAELGESTDYMIASRGIWKATEWKRQAQELVTLIEKHRGHDTLEFKCHNIWCFNQFKWSENFFRVEKHKIILLNVDKTSREKFTNWFNRYNLTFSRVKDDFHPIEYAEARTIAKESELKTLLQQYDENVPGEILSECLPFIHEEFREEHQDHRRGSLSSSNLNHLPQVSEHPLAAEKIRKQLTIYESAYRSLDRRSRRVLHGIKVRGKTEADLARELHLREDALRDNLRLAETCFKNQFWRLFRQFPEAASDNKINNVLRQLSEQERQVLLAIKRDNVRRYDLRRQMQLRQDSFTNILDSADQKFWAAFWNLNPLNEAEGRENAA